MKAFVIAPSTPRIKICGITRETDAACLRDLGVDAMGLVFYAASPRAITLAQASRLVKVAGPLVSATGLFVNADAATIHEVLREVPLQLLQFHGEESVEFCAQFQRPWLKAIRVQPGMDVAAACQPYHRASGLLFDTYKPGVQGGTGEVFDWKLLKRENRSALADMSIILAGGLNPSNVTEAVDCVQPYAVDVSGGVESGPGQKDPQKMRAFVEAVRRRS